MSTLTGLSALSGNRTPTTRESYLATINTPTSPPSKPAQNMAGLDGALFAAAERVRQEQQRQAAIEAALLDAAARRAIELQTYDANARNLNALISASGRLSAVSEAQARQDYQHQLNMLNLGKMSNALAQQQVAGDRKLAEAIHKIQTGKIQNALGWTWDQENFARDRHGIEAAWIQAQGKAVDELYNLDLRDIDLSRERLANETLAHRQGWREQLALGGGGATQSLAIDKHLINENDRIGRETLDNESQRLTTIYVRDKAGLDRATKLNDLELKQTVTKLARERTDLNFDLQKANLDRVEAERQAELRMKHLTIEAAKYNMSAENLAKNLQLTLQKIGLERQISVGRLMEEKYSNDAARARLANDIIAEAVKLATISMSKR